MDAHRFDELLRNWNRYMSRRTVLAGLVIAGLLGRLGIADGEAKKKKKKKPKKKKNVCQRGTQTCGGTCCAPANCINGGCCPSDRACGAVCCQENDICGDAETATCVTGMGNCPPGAHSCAGNVDVCNGNDQCFCVQATNGDTRCATRLAESDLEPCGVCNFDSDCEPGFSNTPGVFCAKDAQGSVCGCLAVENACLAPCPK